MTKRHTLAFILLTLLALAVTLEGQGGGLSMVTGTIQAVGSQVVLDVSQATAIRVTFGTTTATSGTADLEGSPNGTTGWENLATVNYASALPLNIVKSTFGYSKVRYRTAGGLTGGSAAVTIVAPVNTVVTVTASTGSDVNVTNLVVPVDQYSTAAPWRIQEVDATQAPIYPYAGLFSADADTGVGTKPYGFAGLFTPGSGGPQVVNLPTSLGGNGGIKVEFPAAQAVTVAGVATAAAQTDGTQKAIARGAAKGATAAGDVTSTAASANRQPLDTNLYTAAGVAYDARQIRALTLAGDAVNVTGSTVSLADPSKIRAQQWNATGGSSSFTSATAIDTSISQSSLDLLAGIILAVDENATGGFSAGQLNFEAQQQTTGKWVAVQALRFDSLTLENTFALSGFTGARSWQIVVPPGTTSIRVRLNPAITGAGTLNLNLTGGSAPLITRAVTADPAADTSLASIDTKTPALVSGREPVDGSGVTQPVSAVSLPLPSGAATGVKQDTGNASLASIDTKLTAPLSVTGPVTDAQLRATPVPVSGPVTDAQLRATPVPVSGPLTDAQLRATPVPVSNASLPLPANAAQETNGNLALIAANVPTPVMNATPVVVVTPKQLASPFQCNALRRTNCSTF